MIANELGEVLTSTLIQAGSTLRAILEADAAYKAGEDEQAKLTVQNSAVMHRDGSALLSVDDLVAAIRDAGTRGGEEGMG